MVIIYVTHIRASYICLIIRCEHAGVTQIRTEHSSIRIPKPIRMGTAVRRPSWEDVDTSNSRGKESLMAVCTSQNNCSGLDISICMTHKPPRGNTG